MSNMRLSKMKFPNDENMYDVIDSNSFVNVNHSDGQYTFTKEDGNTVSVNDNSVTRRATSETGSRVLELTDAASAPLVKCVTQITGSQDLHGYNKPWVGGAGKNKLNASDTTVKNGYVFNDTSVNLSPGTYTFSVFVTGTPTASKQINIMDRTGESSVLGFTTIRAGRNTITFTTETPITSVASFTNTTDSVDISEIQIESGSSFTTFAPYSNICPITAYTEGEIEVRGKNLWDESYTRIINELTYQPIYVGDGTFTLSTTTPARSGNTANLFLLPGNVNSGASSAYSGVYQGKSITDTAIDGYVTIAYRNYEIDPRNYKTQLEKGSSPTTYEPYTSTTHTTTYPSAIYRGSEDVVGSSVNSSHLRFTVSSGIELYGNYGDDNAPLFYVDMPEYIITYVRAGFSEDVPISNFYNATTGSSVSTMHDFEFRTETPPSGTFAKRVYLRDSRFTTAADFNTFIATNPIQFVFKLATESTSSVTPTNLPIKSLSGYNHIESSTGEMEVEYITEEEQPIIDLIESNAINVVPNPEGSATSTLNKLGIDNIIYDFPKELPTVTSTDNEKVLTVVNGTWTKANPQTGMSESVVADEYDSTKTYNIADYCMHSGKLYECNTDNTTGTWDDSKWDSTNLAEQIAKAKQTGVDYLTVQNGMVCAVYEE